MSEGCCAPGLRREEVAAAAGVSVDYLTRLQQGRARHPSAQVLSALSAALRLSDPEREHLFAAAGHRAPDDRLLPTRPTPGVRRLLDRLGDVPASVLDPAWTLLAWNPLWAALMGTPSPAAGRDRNLLWRHFAGHPSRIVRGPDATREFEVAAVADLRAAAGRHPHDPTLHALVADLLRTSDRFAVLWRERRVAPHAASRKTVAHPEVGEVTLDCDVLTVHGGDLRLVVYTVAAGGRDADALALLGLLGVPAGAG